MKKSLLVIFVAAIIIVTGITFYLSKQKLTLDIDEIVPDNAMLYAQASHIDKNWKYVQSTDLWKGLSQIDYDRLMEKNGMSDQQRAVMDNIQLQMSSFKTQLFMENFLSKDVALIAYPVNIDFSKLVKVAPEELSQFIAEIFSNFYLVTRIKAEAEVAEFISRFFKQFGGNVVTETAEYKEHTLRIFSLANTDISIGLVKIKDLLVVGLGDRPLRKVIDVYKGDRKSLIEDDRYQEAKNKALKEADIFLYWDMEQFFSLFKEQVEAIKTMAEQTSISTEEMREVEKGLDEVNKNLAGFKALTFSSLIDSLTQTKFNVLFDRNELDPTFARFYVDCESVKNSTIEFVPQEVLIYQWSNCFDLKIYWNEALNEAAKRDDKNTATVNEKIREFERNTGLSIENDILSAFGDEIGGYLSDIKEGGLFPLPEFVFFVKIQDKSKADKLLSQIGNNQLFILKSEDYSNIKVNYFSSPLGAVLQPGYCYIDNYLLISINKSLLIRSIDAKKNKSKSVLTKEDFKRIDRGLSDRNTAVQYVDVDVLMDKLGSVFKWLNQWAESREIQQQAFRRGFEQRLADSMNTIRTYENAIKEMKESIIYLEGRIREYQGMGLAADDKRQEIQQIETDIKTKESEMAAAREQAKELEETIKGYKDRSSDPELRKFYLEEIVYPLLESFRSINAYGARTTSQGDSLESMIYMEVH